jgi:hypothetical protein
MIYALADVLGMPLEVSAEGMIEGSQSRDINLGGLRLKVKPTVVSSRMTDNAYMVIVKVVGNLALFVAAKRVKQKDVVDLHVINIAKMDATTGFLEKHKLDSVNVALKRMGPAVVKSFIKIKKDEWEIAA